MRYIRISGVGRGPGPLLVTGDRSNVTIMVGIHDNVERKRGSKMETDNANSGESSSSPSWQPLTSYQRRVAGVLIEKAKTTPAAYPMTLNAITTGCNQKSNRAPILDLSVDQVETVLDELRSIGAVIEVQGSGRVSKYRHCMYEWLGVDKREIAVMAELLLRGEQTVGELRGRAARMEAIPDIGELRPIIQSLIDRKLVVALTPAGRGQMLTHGLYREREKDKLFEKLDTSGGFDIGGDEPTGTGEPAQALMTATPRTPDTTPRESEQSSADLEAIRSAIKEELEQIKDDILQLSQRMESLEQLLR